MDILDDLIALERAAEQEREHLTGLDGDEHDAQWRRWRTAADTFQAAVTTHAAASGENRVDVEMAVKKAVRWPETAEGYGRHSSR